MTTMSIKSGPQGCRIAGIRPETAFGLMICWTVCFAHGHGLQQTSGADSKHQRASLHYVFLAADFKIVSKVLLSVEELSSFVRKFKAALGDDYDIIFEGDHFHLEFQPKTPMNGG